jgi:uncharacterized protein YndB with AHSA1/START domain
MPLPLHRGSIDWMAREHAPTGTFSSIGICAFRRLTLVVSVLVFRPGGVWKHTMHGPNGVDYPNRLVYDEIIHDKRIVYSHHGGIDGVPAQFQQTATFIQRGDRTELTMRMVFRTAAERDAVAKKYGAVEGAKQTMARLAEHLDSPARNRPELRMTREFDAPKRLVFEAWSKAEHVARWFTPAPLTTPSCEVDLRTGGVFRLVMRMPDGMEFPMDAKFIEVIAEERIVFEAVIHGGVNLYTTIDFLEHDGKTTLSAYQIYSHESDATRGANAGWTQTLNQLGEYLRHA